MAANPNRQTPHPQHQPRPHRLTTPLEPGSIPLSDAVQMYVRITCWRCHGAGRLLDAPYAVCDAPECHGKRYTPEQIERHGGWYLPCGHLPAGGEISMSYDDCPTCAFVDEDGNRRAGHLYRWLPFGEHQEYQREQLYEQLPAWFGQWFEARFEGWFQDWFEEHYETISQAITARMRRVP